MSDLAHSIASEETLIQGPVQLGPHEICVVANMPSGLRRQLAGKETSYRVLGPRGTYSRLTGLPFGGDNYGITLTTDIATVKVPVEDVGIAGT